MAKKLHTSLHLSIYNPYTKDNLKIQCPGGVDGDSVSHLLSSLLMLYITFVSTIVEMSFQTLTDRDITHVYNTHLLFE